MFDCIGTSRQGKAVFTFDKAEDRIKILQMKSFIGLPIVFFSKSNHWQCCWLCNIHECFFAVLIHRLYIIIWMCSTTRQHHRAVSKKGYCQGNVWTRKADIIYYVWLQMVLKPNQPVRMGRRATLGPAAASSPGSSSWPCWVCGHL